MKNPADSVKWTFDDPSGVPFATIEDLHVFMDAVLLHPQPLWVYRGHADKRWKLMPKAGREEFDFSFAMNADPEALPPDLAYFQGWKQKAIAY